jgi:branched-chain amino acid aminotransferase
MTKAEPQDHWKTGAAPQVWTWLDGAWKPGDIDLPMPVMSPAGWLGQSVFDGARAFDGVAPDLDRHAERCIASARYFGMEPPVDAAFIQRVAWEGIAKFPRDKALYVRPMMWPAAGFIRPDAKSTRFALTVNEAPLPGFAGFTACLATTVRRPSPEQAPTEAKAGCLYPNVARALGEAAGKGFDNAIVLDPVGNVAEFASANLWIVKNGVAATPVVNGSFLNGITRQRVATLLAGAGVRVEERRVTYADVMQADEVFSSGNYAKVQPCVRVDDRHLQPGPIAQKAYKLYFDWARTTPSRLKA